MHERRRTVRISPLPFAAGIFSAGTLVIKVTALEQTWTLAAIVGAIAAVSGIAVLLFTSRPRSRRRAGAGAALLLTLVPLAHAARDANSQDPTWIRFTADIRHDISNDCHGERGREAIAIFDQWVRARRATTIDCVPTEAVGSYGNGMRLGVTIAGRVDPACPRPRDLTYWLGSRSLILHFCEADA